MPNFTKAISSLRKTLDDIFDRNDHYVKDAISQLKLSKKIQDFHKRLWESQKVKTIWHTDRPLSLSSFFYPVNIQRLDDDKPSVHLRSLDNLPNNHNLIFGTVGQGKSILLRYLLGREISSGTRIPVFCELRNVGDSTIENHIVERFSNLTKVSNAEILFEALAIAGKLTFLLDGFDEVDGAKTQKLLNEIEELSFKYSDCRIVVTSRPDSDCRHLTSFYVNRISPLEEKDLNGFYTKITRDKDFTVKLVSAINSSPLQIRGLINTPLLATLLAISYRAAQKIPLDFAEFYEDLFQILLVRHDGAKLGWRRARKTKFNDKEIQKAFEAFCFSTRRVQLAIFTKEVALDLAHKSLDKCELVADAGQFIEDIKRITCLMLEEGKKLTFVHSSVPEFFAASYIKSRPDPVAASFYSQLLDNEKWQDWTQEILFLQQIDEHRILKYFILPDLLRTLKGLIGSDNYITQSHIDSFLLTKSVIKENVIRSGANFPRFLVQENGDLNTYHHSIIKNRAYNILFKSVDIGAVRSWNFAFALDPNIKERSYLDIAKDRGEKSFLTTKALLKAQLNQFISQKEEIELKIIREERPDDFINLDEYK